MAKSPYTEIPWPVSGVSLHSGYTHQDAGTCIDALNVRGYDPTTNALRGAQRAGHSPYCPTQISGSNYIQALEHVVTSGAISGTGVRSIVAIAVSAGNVVKFDRTGTTAVTNGTGALDSTNPFIGTAILFSVVYFADGTNYKTYTPSTNTVNAWTASAGTLPISGSDTPRLICNWRGRIVLSGIKSDPQNWFMSRQFDATDFDYTAGITQADAQEPVAGNNAEAGQVPDIVTCLIPYSDDLLLFGGDHSIYQMTGDPAAGGQLDRISDTVGIAFGSPWCKDAFGNVYFLGSRGGVYRCQPSGGGGAAPERISSKKIDAALLDLDLSKVLCKMVWDDRFQTVMIYITDPSGTVETTHYAYDIRNDAFWPDSFTNALHNPVSVHLMDGDDPADRVVLLGGRDGYVRFIDTASKLDDDAAISSYVVLGPIRAGSGRFRVKELRCVLGELSDQACLEILRSHSPESAFRMTEPVQTMTLGPGRSRAIRLVATGQAMYLKIRNASPNTGWQYEALFVWLEAMGLAGGRMLHK